jgi:hypothetical protein
MNSIPVFRNPFPANNRQVVHHMNPLQLNPFQAVSLQMNPFGLVVEKSIEYVGAVFINRPHGRHSYDIIFAKSDLGVYEAFGINLAKKFDPLGSMNTILNKIGYNVTQFTPYIDIENPMNGKLCKIYIINIHHFSCTTTSLVLKSNVDLNRAFFHFARFSVKSVTDDNVMNGVSFNTFSRKLFKQIAVNYRAYI